jgi:hypothetical protein
MEHLISLFDHFCEQNQKQLNENINEDIINFRVQFVLSEAKTTVSSKKSSKVKAPWGKESWLETNPKIQKNAYVRDKVHGKNIVYHSYIINLLPAKESGINVCACATPDCAKTCLHQSGNIGMLVGKTASRFRKTWYLYMDREKAVAEIVNQVKAKNDKIHKLNASGLPYKTKTEKEVENPLHILVIRLNGTSDIRWLDQPVDGAKNIFYKFPDVVWYDYTKMPQTADEYVEGDDFPPNYHITFSYGGKENKSNTIKFLNQGMNVAVAFAPGKTNPMEELVFPADMVELFRNFKYPLDENGEGMSAQNQKLYREEILQELREKGLYCEPSELSPFVRQTLLPGYFSCHEVIDGDSYDGRFLDDFYYHKDDDKYISHAGTFQIAKQNKPGLVIGLTAKGPLAYEFYDQPQNDSQGGWDINKTGQFIVGPNDDFLDTSNCKDQNLIDKTEVYKKLSAAIFLLRNRDARHASLHLAPSGTMDRRKLETLKSEKPRKTLQPPKEKDLLHTYVATKERFQKEMDHVRTIFKYVLDKDSAKNPEIKAKVEALIGKGEKDNKKFTDVVKFAQDFKKYIEEKVRSGELSEKIADGYRKNIMMIFNPEQLLDKPTLFSAQDLLKRIIAQKPKESLSFKEWFNWTSSNYM